MGDRHAKQLALGDLIRERRIGGDRFQENMFATKLQRTIANERARQQPGFAEDLETVANAKHQASLRGETLHRLHHRAEPRDGARAQVVAVAESAGNNHGIGVTERSFLMPDESGRMAEDIAQDMHRVLVAIRSRKLENGEVHWVG